MPQDEVFNGKLTVPASVRRLADMSTPFGEMAVSQRTPIIQINGSYDTSMLRDVMKTTGTASIESVDSEFELKTQTTGEKATMLSASRGRYTPGYAGECGVGIRVPEVPEGDSIIRAGYFDTVPGGQAINDGAVFEKRADSNSIAIYKKGELITRVREKDWNLAPDEEVDLADGWILQILFVYYGYGPIWFRLLSPTRERVIDLHKELTFGRPSLANSNLQVGCQIENEQDSELVAYLSGRQFAVLGNPIFKIRKVSHLRQNINVPTTNYVPVMSFRRKSGRRAVPIQIKELEAITNNDIVIQWRVGADINDTEWITPNNHDSDEVALEVNVDADTVDMNIGVKVDEDLIIGGTGPQPRQFTEDETASDIPDESVVTMCAKSIDGSAATLTAIGKMVEER